MSMFGGHNDTTAPADENAAATAPVADGQLAGEEASTSSAPEITKPTDTEAGDYMLGDAPASDPAPLSDDHPVADTPAADLPAAPTLAEPTLPTAGGDDLLGIKQQALQQLTPLLGHLDQTAEEKFRTTMMMIQASDNDSLIESAYKAAMDISDEKVRAQALLDIVNEINYFTQQKEAAA